MNLLRNGLVALLLAGIGAQAVASDAVAAPPTISLAPVGEGEVAISMSNATDDEFAAFLAAAVAAEAPVALAEHHGVMTATVSKDALFPRDGAPFANKAGVGVNAFWRRKTFRAYFRWLWESSSDPVRCTDITVRGGYLVALAYFTSTYPGITHVSHLDAPNSEGGCP
ncbi:MAG: hypothetical protein JNN30_05555 [Rhodanobacteraceae bacterium]|nr:hypothetical protein [Rhodanobacteraceae bacterium]